MEMHRTPCISGGSSIWSITTGGRTTPSMRGMEKPYTSASITATDLPAWASATARLVVSDDLPTPPLPEAMSRTRVVDDGSENGMARPSACPWAGWLPAVALGSPCNICRSSVRSSSVMTVNSMAAESTPSSATTASVTRRSISLRSGHPEIVRATSTDTEPSVMVTSRTMPRSTMLRCSSGS